MVEVTLDAAEIVQARSETLLGITVLERLRKAGVPARGSIMLLGVERGVLSMSEDAFGSTVFTWRDD